MLSFAKNAGLLLMLLNPFLLVVYLLDLVQDLDLRCFSRVLLRGAAIATCVFVAFAWAGEAIFTSVLHARFASFQIFGGIVFLIIGIQFVYGGADALRSLRGKPEHVAGSIAMPMMIGPATVSASVLVGVRLPCFVAALAVGSAVAVTVVVVIGLKALHDYVRPRHEALVERYVEVAGRLAALIIGTFAVEMIMTGYLAWTTR